MKCANCGFENAAGAKFCISCATPLPAEAGASAPPAATRPPPTSSPSPATPASPPSSPTEPITPPIPPASPPPAAPAASAPGGPPPAAPGGSKAALFGLAAFGAIAVIGALLWFFVLKPDAKPDCTTQQAGVGCQPPIGIGTPTTPPPTIPTPTLPSPTISFPSPTPTIPSPSPTDTPTPTTTPTDDPPPPPPNDGRLGFIVGPCSRVTPANECKGYAFRRNAGEREFSIRVVVYNEQPNKQLVVNLVDVRTGSALLNDTRWTTTGGEVRVYVVNITSRGMPSGLDAEILVRYAGKRIRFEPPAIIRWR